MATQTTTTEKVKSVTLTQGLTRSYTGAAALAGDFDKIPVIDLTALHNPEATQADRDRLVADVRDACARVGFFVIKNHGIDWQVVEAAFDGLQEFFGLPDADKMTIHQDMSPSFMGYEQMYYTNVGGKTKGDKKEGVSVAYEPAIDPQGLRGADAAAIPSLMLRTNLWPAAGMAPKFQAGVQGYQLACLALMRKLIRVLAQAMGMPESFFDNKTTYPVASVRCLYYPPQDASEDDEVAGLGAHTDVQLMTFIAQRPYRQQALEVLNKAGDWIRPELPEPNCFVVNICDMTARLTNDVFQSTIHRVRNNSDGAQDRYSLPFFFGLNPDELVTTLPQFVTPDNPLKPNYRQGLTSYEHYNNRLKKAHHQHPTATGNVSSALPPGMTRADGKLVDGL